MRAARKHRNGATTRAAAEGFADGREYERGRIIAILYEQANRGGRIEFQLIRNLVGLIDREKRACAADLQRERENDEG